MTNPYPDQNVCNMCGQCCLSMIHIYPNSELQREWALARGMTIEEENKDFIMCKLNAPCPHVKQDQGGHWLCVMDPKPNCCLLYPRIIKGDGLKEMGLSVEKFLGKHCGYVKCYKDGIYQE